MKEIAQLTSFDADSDDLDSEGWLCEHLELNLNSLCTLAFWSTDLSAVTTLQNNPKYNLLVGMCFLPSSAKVGKIVNQNAMQLWHYSYYD